MRKTNDETGSQGITQGNKEKQGNKEDDEESKDEIKKEQLQSL